MINKTAEIKEFLHANFQPGTLDDFTIIRSSSGILTMLFDVFPRDCIDTYDLYEILISLHYAPQKISKKIENEEGKTNTSISFYWILKERSN